MWVSFYGSRKDVIHSHIQFLIEQKCLRYALEEIVYFKNWNPEWSTEKFCKQSGTGKFLESKVRVLTKMDISAIKYESNTIQPMMKCQPFHVTSLMEESKLAAAEQLFKGKQKTNLIKAIRNLLK